MSKGKAFRIYKRAMAFFMAAALVVSTFQGMSITAYATEDVIISDADLQETGEIIEETVAEESTPEATQEPAVEESTPEATQEPTVEATATPETTPEAEATQEPEATSEPEATATPEATQEPETTPEATQEPEATATPETTPEAEATQEPEATPEATSEPEATATPEATTLPYTGTLYSNGEGLGIYFYEMLGVMDFTDENLVAILESHADETYKYIMISYPDIPDAVGQNVWNAVEAIAAEDATFYAGFTGGSAAADEMWVAHNPTTASADVELAADWSIKEDGTLSLSFGNTAVPAESTDFSITAYQTNIEEIYNSLKGIFPANNKLKIKDASGNRQGSFTSYVRVSESDVSVSIDDIGLLTSDTTYSVSNVPTITYVGTIDNENKTLVIQAEEISEAYGEFNDDILIDVIDANRTNYYSSVTIVYDEVKDVINKNVWNMAVELLAGDAPELTIGFPNETAPNENWFFVNPGVTESDLDTSLDMSVNNVGGGATVTFNNTTFPADSAVLVASSESTKTENAAFKAAFYQRHEAYNTCIRDDEGKDVEGLGSNFLVNEDGSARFVMELYSKTEEGAYQLTSGKAYTILTPYGGITWEDENSGVTGLDIVPHEVGRESFTIEEIQRILAENGDARYDEILIEYPVSETNTVSAEVLNALSGYLKWSEGVDQYLRIGFYDHEAQEYYQWRICNPTEQTEDKTVSAVLSAEEESAVTIQVSGASFNADRTDVVIDYGNETATAKRLKDCFGSENIPLALEGLETGGYYEVYEDYVSMAFVGVNGYAADTAYIVVDGRYWGEIHTDEAGNQRLIVDYHELWNRGQDDSPEVYVDILNYYAGISFVAVHITVPAGEDDRVNEIDKGIYNAARKLLTTESNREGIYYNFNHDEKNILWYLRDGKALSKNVTMQYEVYINEYGKAALKVKLPSAKDLGNASASLAIEYVKDTDAANELLNFLGEGMEDGLENVKYRLFPKASIEIPVKWVDMGETLKLGFMYNIRTLTNDKEYVISEKYPGHVEDTEVGRELYISAYEIGKETFAAGDLADYLSYYVSAISAGEMVPFNQIHVEQSYVEGKNTIRKDDINLLNKLLAEDDGFSNRNLTFVFCNCEYEEASDTNYTYDVNWSLFNPKTATKNINANVTLKKVANQGMSVKYSENTYKADSVSVQFRVDKALELGSGMVEVLGDVTEYGKELVVLKKAGNSFTGSVVSCWSEEDNAVFSLYLNDVEQLAADTEYLVAPFYNMIQEDSDVNTFFIGDDEGNRQKLFPAGTPDPNTTVTWKSYDTALLRIASDGSSVEALNDGEVYYAASYASNGVQTLDVFRNRVSVKLNSISFDKTSLTMTLPEEGADWQAEDYLRVKFYPSLASKDQSELEWTVETLEMSEDVEGENVVELEEYEADVELEDGNWGTETRCTGRIFAVNPGKAIVTATDLETGISASCTITVDAPLVVPENAWPDAWAVTNFETTLEDVEFHMSEDAEGSWRWEEPSTSLATFKSMDGHDFNAIYTMADGREITCKVWVRMVTIESIRVIETALNDDTLSCEETEPHTSLKDGEYIVLNYDLNIKNGGYDEVAEYLESNRVSITWSSNPAGIGTQEGLEEAGYWSGSCKFTADLSRESTGKGKKTFTVSLKDNETEKIVAKGSHIVTVVANPLTEWDKLEVYETYVDENVVGVPGEKGTLFFKFPTEYYKRLTITSLDPAVCKLGTKATVDRTSEEGYVITKIAYEIKAPGTVFLEIKSADEMKSSICLRRDILDIAPKYTGEMLTINKKWEDKTDEFTLQLAQNSVLTSLNPADYELTGTGAQYFKIGQIIDNGDCTATFVVELIDSNAPKKKYDLKVNKVAVTYTNGEEETSGTYSISIPVKVTNSVPSVTFGQSSKVNLFYTDEEGYDELTIKASGSRITSVSLGDYVDKKPSKNAVCDYELIQPEDGLFLIKPKDGTTGAKKKGTITYTLEGYEGTYTKTFTVETENKAPALTLSAKSDVVYPNVGDAETMLVLTDKKTKEPVNISAVKWIKNAKKKQYVELPAEWVEGAPSIDMKNSYIVNWDFNIIFFNVIPDGAVAQKDKIELQVWEENWSKPVKVTYSITTNLKTPKLVLGSKNITLNVNEAVYEHQMTGTTLRLDKATENLKYIGVRFVGADAKSRAILNRNLVLEYWGDTGQIWAKFNAKDVTDRPAAGTYKFSVYADVWGKTLTTQLTVKVVDKPVSRCLEVTKKGSIDVLNREGTSITFTPKISNITGKVVDGYLIGKDADMFETYWENNKLVVHARIGTTYAANYSYKVQPVFFIQNDCWDGYEITGAVQTIKVKQGKPKVTVSAPSNILFRNRSNELELNFKAVLNKKTNVVIEDVNLLNYNSDLVLEEWFVMDEEENGYYVHFNPETQSVTLSQQGINQIAATNKKWKLKFEVRFRDKAGNVKTQQVTYKVVIK